MITLTPWPTSSVSSVHYPSAVQVQIFGELHPNILKDAHVRPTHTGIKDITNNHARTLVDFFSPLPISRASPTSRCAAPQHPQGCAWQAYLTDIKDTTNNHVNTLVDVFNPLLVILMCHTTTSSRHVCVSGSPAPTSRTSLRIMPTHWPISSVHCP